MLHIHIAFNVNVTPEYASKTCMPCHKTCNSSISGYKYTSMFTNVIDYLLGLIKAKIIKYRLVTTKAIDCSSVKSQAMLNGMNSNHRMD
jgi:hypothetical protein